MTDPGHASLPPDGNRRPLVGVGVVVLRGEDVLLVQRGRPPRVGEWSLPGGKQEWGETVRQAACREVCEETGVEIMLGGLIDVVDLIAPPEERHYTLVDFWAIWQSGDVCAGDDAADASWFDSRAIASLPLWDETRRVIALARELAQQAGAGSAG